MDVEIKYEDLDDIDDDDESGSDVDAVRVRDAWCRGPPVTCCPVWQDALFQLEESPHVDDAAHRCAHAFCLSIWACLTGTATPLSLPKSIDETADKLDGMMDIVFAYMGRCVVTVRDLRRRA